MGSIRVMGAPIALLPVLFHLIWRRELHVDLSKPLTPDTVVSPATLVSA
jgi:hypothetical protein